jgi:asparagine synthase (glutamine-hydrolysing)
MGAICGYIGSGDGALLRAAMLRLRHRAPVPTGEHVGERIGLAQGSFAPPSSAGPAPAEARLPGPAGVATSADGAVRCVLDGALVNRRDLREDLERRGVHLQAGTDAEIAANLFRLDGERAFARLDGALALAFDAGGTLYLVRDALGEKPLYYTSVPTPPGQTLLFASETKAFLAHPAFTVRPNLRALHRLLIFSFIPGEESMFEGVSELRPGYFLRQTPDGVVSTTCYWDVTEDIQEADEESLVAALRSRVRTAVEQRVQGRTHVGAFLSGGIDSSAVVAVLRDLGVRVTAFSAGFGHGQPNELKYARMVAEHTRAEHRTIHVEPDQFLDLLPSIMYNLDDPLCDCITVPNYILAREAAREVSVVFNGEGGDPLFGGPKNKFLILNEWYGPFGQHDRARAYLASYHKLYDHLGALCTPEFLARTGGNGPIEDEVRPFLEDVDLGHFLNRLMRVNVKLKGGQNILVKVDKMLSANGVEAASPLFDRTLTELSFTIPPRWKRKGDVEKYVFKKAVESLLPHSVTYRKKVGMGVPLNHWFESTSLRGYAMDILNSKRATERGYFQPSFTEALFSGKGPPFSYGQDRSGEFLWMLLAIELWHRVFVDGEGQP